MLNYLSGPTRQRGNHEARPGFPTPRVCHSATQSFGLVQDNDTCTRPTTSSWTPLSYTHHVNLRPDPTCR